MYFYSSILNRKYTLQTAYNHYYNGFVNLISYTGILLLNLSKYISITSFNLLKLRSRSVAHFGKSKKIRIGTILVYRYAKSSPRLVTNLNAFKICGMYFL